MTKLRALMMALPLMVASVPALATDLTGSYLITITGGRGAYPVGATGCIKLSQTGDVLDFKNSGVAMSRGHAGEYYALNSVITVAFPKTILSGILIHRGLSYGTLTTVSSNGGTVTGANSFTATRGCH